MDNKIKEGNEIKLNIKVSSDINNLQFEIQTKIIKLFGDQIEPEQQEGEKGLFIYHYKNLPRPSETFVVYILNKIVLDNLSKQNGKALEGLHTHTCTNTKGEVICWPQKLDTIGETKEMIKNWAGLVGALLVSKNINDINEFYNENDQDWMSNTIKNSKITIEIN